MVRRLSREIAKLPVLEKLVMSLHYVERLSVQETGVCLTMTEAAVAAVLDGALRRVRASLVPARTLH